MMIMKMIMDKKIIVIKSLLDHSIPHQLKKDQEEGRIKNHHIYKC